MSDRETKVITRQVRQIARCRRCKTVRSRLVTRTTTSTYWWSSMGPRSSRKSVDTLSDGGEVPTVDGHAVSDAGPCACDPPRRLHFLDVEGRKNDHECDPRCRNATGFHCECSCGGLNHGANYSAS